MKLFSTERANQSPRHRRIYAIYELFHTSADLAAAVLFIIGSALFFFDSLTYAGTWCFLVGSIFFAVKPGLRFARELHFYLIGDLADLTT
ncbi:YrhK family protein [Martelella endophytica]|uniref:YrhK domain-containing protein n=1 Tax=Martelella endophytica TaxID=1486262 RepID=A0A0D5LLT5_MAREN|nr:YrhK family protein [Martelella endophytica]AJY45164.1 hypothetical protein TM49_04790 [Martelella endophytica]